MNKITKILLITAGSCLGIGLILGVLGMIQARNNNYEAFKSNREKVVTEITDGFENIEIDEVSDDIIIMPSEDGKVIVETWDGDMQYHDVGVEDNTLKITFRNKGSYITFDLDFMEDEEDYKTVIYLPAGEYKDFSINGTSSDVEIPDIYTFEDVSISLVSGDIRDSAYTTGTLNINTTSGEVDDLNINGISADINTVSGNINISSCNVSGSIDIDVTSGDVTLNDVTTSAANINSVSGDITFNGFESGATNIDTTSGNINATLIGNYKINTDTVSGNVSIGCDNLTDGASFDVSTVSGDITIN